MIVLGLTGSMAMGKSSITRMLRLIYHVPVWDADQAVRDLLVLDPDLIQEIANRYPKVMVGGKIDRSLLRSRAFEDEECLTTLEHLIHERAYSQMIQFLEKMRRLSIPWCVVDVPLLFEVNWHSVCTHTAVVYAPSFIQQQRLQRRPDLNESKIEHILRRQWTLAQKRELATYEIQSGLSKGHTFRQLRDIIEDMKSMRIKYA
jgi:dephospho-CoA kinase